MQVLDFFIFNNWLVYAGTEFLVLIWNGERNIWKRWWIYQNRKIKKKDQVLNWQGILIKSSRRKLINCMRDYKVIVFTLLKVSIFNSCLFWVLFIHVSFEIFPYLGRFNSMHVDFISFLCIWDFDISCSEYKII